MIATRLDTAPVIGQGRHLDPALFSAAGVSRVTTRGGIVRVRRQPQPGAPRLLLGVDGPNVIEQYDPLLSSLRGHADVTLFEPPGTGGSAPASGFTFTIDDFTQATLEVIGALGLAPVTLVFPCYLGYVAHRLARLEPKLAERVVTIQTPGWADMSRWANRVDRNGVLRRPLLGQLVVRARRPWLARLWYRSSAGNAGQGAILSGAALDVLRRGGCFCLASLMQGLSAAREDVQPLPQPLLGVWGDRDRSHARSRPESGVELAHTPAVRLVRFPELGHSPELEAPAAFAEALLSWMAL